MGLNHTVSGDIASFRTPSRVPIESLTFHFLPKQEGSGDPSPSNVRPITGWTGLNGRSAGKNLFNSNDIILGKWVLRTGFDDDNRGAITKEIPVTSGEKYSLSCSGTTIANTPLSMEVVELDGNKQYLRRNYATTEASSENPPNDITFIIGSNTKYIVCGVYNKVTAAINTDKIATYKMQLEKGGVTEYEPYSGSIIPITFPTNGKNLVNDETTTLKNWTAKDERRYISTNTDTRDSVSMYVVQYDSNDVVLKNNVKYTPVVIGRNSLTINVVKGCSKILLKHNGTVRDFGIFIPWDGRVGTYTISANFESIDLSTVGGFIFSDVQIELGDTMTSYELYSSGNTFYGGYIDPVRGKLVAEYKAHVFDGTENLSDYSSGFTNGIRLVSQLFDDCTGTGNLTKCDKAVLETTVPYSISRLGIRIGGGTGRFYFYIPDSMFDGEATIDKFKTWLSENNMAVVAKLTTPIEYDITPTQLQAFLDHNNFWSDANDITEVTYAVTESKDILATRKRAMDFDIAHHKKVEWNQIQIDG